MARTAGSRAEITGPRIEQAALSLFARYGYAAVSMRQIATEVGVQAGALYNYIPDKQTLLVDLMSSHLEGLLASFEDDASLSPPERLKAFVDFHIQYHHDRRDAVFIAYMELRNLTTENFKRIEALRQRYEARLEIILKDGASQSGFRIIDEKVTTRAIIAMLTGVTTWFKEDGRLSLQEVQDQYWALVRQAVGL